MIDFSKFKNNRALQITAIIAIPAVFVGGYFLWKHFRRNSGEPKGKGEITAETKHKDKIIFTKNKA